MCVLVGKHKHLETKPGEETGEGPAKGQVVSRATRRQMRATRLAPSQVPRQLLIGQPAEQRARKFMSCADDTRLCPLPGCPSGQLDTIPMSKKAWLESSRCQLPIFKGGYVRWPKSARAALARPPANGLLGAHWSNGLSLPFVRPRGTCGCGLAAAFDDSHWRLARM